MVVMVWVGLETGDLEATAVISGEPQERLKAEMEFVVSCVFGGGDLGWGHCYNRGRVYSLAAASLAVGMYFSAGVDRGSAGLSSSEGTAADF